jgi:UDP-glucose 6-dehydrogenase
MGGLFEKRVAVLGLAFKPGTDDLRDSPGMRLARRLAARGAIVRTHDPLPLVRQRARDLLEPAVATAETAEQALVSADAAVIATAWPEYRQWDWPALAARMARPLILDGRFALDGLELPSWIRLERIGTGPTLSA